MYSPDGMTLEQAPCWPTSRTAGDPAALLHRGMVTRFGLGASASPPLSHLGAPGRFRTRIEARQTYRVRKTGEAFFRLRRGRVKRW